MIRSQGCRALAAVAICVLVPSHFVTAQAPAGAKPPVLSTSGRFQLLAQPEGHIFMIDSASGRVWRYTKVTANDQQVKNYLQRFIRAEEVQRSKLYTDDERKTRENVLRGEHAGEIESLANPCNGLVTCFVEVDRVKLSSAGALVSEVVK